MLPWRTAWKGEGPLFDYISVLAHDVHYHTIDDATAYYIARYLLHKWLQLFRVAVEQFCHVALLSRTKAKKWPVRVIPHLTSFALANSWLQYLRDASAEERHCKKTKDMLEFETDAALSPIHSNRPCEKKRGRPCLESLQKVLKPAHNAMPLVTMSVRFDGKEHWPQHIATLKFPAVSQRRLHIQDVCVLQEVWSVRKSTQLTTHAYFQCC